MFDWVFMLILSLIVISLLIYIIFSTTNLHLELHGICFLNGFDSFFFVIILNAFIFTSSVFFGMHILPDGSSIVLELLLHLSKLIINS